jgi:hypothetical protein
MARSAVFGLFLVAIGTVGAQGQKEPAPLASGPKGAAGTIDPALQKMIEDLGSDDWRAREKAGRDLAAKGEPALVEMRRALLATESPEVRRRLSVLVRRLDRERLVEPKRVTFQFKNKSAKDIFEEISKQTGYRIEFVGGGAEGKHSFEFEKTAFWQAMDTVASASGLMVSADYGDDMIRVFNQDAVNPHVTYSGPFRFLATNIQSNRNVQLSGLNRRGVNQRINEYLNLSFQIQSEPKNPMLGITQPELTEAKDEFGGSLLPVQDRNNFRSNYYGGSFRGHNTYMNVALNRNDRSASTIKSLKGRVGIVLLAGTVPELVVADPLAAKKKTVAGRSTEIELDSVTEDANQKGTYLVSLTAKKLTPSDPNQNEEFMWSQSVWQRIELADEKGNKYHCVGPNYQPNNAGAVQMVLNFSPDDPRAPGRQGGAKLGPPKKLTVTEWLTLTHEVTFALKDIPLP